jgi:hypothetical protein
MTFQTSNENMHYLSKKIKQTNIYSAGVPEKNNSGSGGHLTITDTLPRLQPKSMHKTNSGKG